MKSKLFNFVLLFVLLFSLLMSGVVAQENSNNLVGQAFNFGVTAQGQGQVQPGLSQSVFQKMVQEINCNTWQKENRGFCETLKSGASFMTFIFGSSAGSANSAGVRFFIFVVIAILASFFLSLTPLPKGSRTFLSIALALFLSLITPNEAIIAASAGWATVFSMILIGAPFVGCIWAYRNVENHWFRTFILFTMLLSWYFTRNFFSKISSLVYVLGPLTSMVWTVGMITIALFFIFSLFTSFGDSKESPQSLQDRARRTHKGFSRIFGGFTKEGREHRRQRNAQTSILNDIVEEKKELHLFDVLRSHISKYLTEYAPVRDHQEIPNHTELVEWNNELARIHKTMTDIDTEEHKWAKTKRREVVEIKRLIKTMDEAGRNKEVIQSMKSGLLALMNDYAAVEKAIKSAQDRWSIIEASHDVIFKKLEKGYNDSIGGVTLTDPLGFGDLHADPGRAADIERTLVRYNEKLARAITEFESFVNTAYTQETSAAREAGAFHDKIRKGWKYVNAEEQLDEA